MATGLPDGALAALSWLWQLACHLPAALAWVDTPQRAALLTVAVLAVAVLAVELAGSRAISASLRGRDRRDAGPASGRRAPAQVVAGGVPAAARPGRARTQ